MKSCLYCGVVDICENFSNAPKTCKNYMRRATIRDLIKLGIFTRTNAPHESTFNKFQIEQINFIIDENKLREKFIFRIKGGEIYFRPIKLNKSWEGVFYEKINLADRNTKYYTIDESKLNDKYIIRIKGRK